MRLNRTILSWRVHYSGLFINEANSREREDTWIKIGSNSLSGRHSYCNKLHITINRILKNNRHCRVTKTNYKVIPTAFNVIFHLTKETNKITVV